MVNRMKDEFLMTVSHELRTPLTAIYGWARMLVTGQIRDEHKRRAIETIERNAQAQTQLVNDLLDVSRAISGKVRLDLGLVDVASIVSAAIDSIQPAAEAKGIRVQADFDPAAGSIWGDAVRLQQIAWNLLSNAVKFTPAGGSIDVRLARNDDARRNRRQRHGQRDCPRVCAVRVRSLPPGRGRHDTAARRARPGFVDRQASRGTSRRHRVRRERRHRKRARRSGCCCRRCGPTARAEAHETCRATRGRRRAFRVGRLDGLRVLVVDDDPQARELLAAILENAGAETRLAGAVRDALEVLRAWWPDVLLSDVEMPDQDGYR